MYPEVMWKTKRTVCDHRVDHHVNIFTVVLYTCDVPLENRCDVVNGILTITVKTETETRTKFQIPQTTPEIEWTI